MSNLFKQNLQPTLKNHFEHGYSVNNPHVFQVKLGALSRSPLTGFEEAVNCAIEIYKNRNGCTLSLCLSGGVDSEAMLLAFIAAGVDFKIYILRFKDELNKFDIQTSMQFCEQRGLKYSIIDLDVINFFESGLHLNYGIKYRCQSPQLAVHLWMCDQIDGLPVLGGNPFVKTEVNGHLFFIGLPGDLHCTYFRYFEQNKREGVPWFFIYSPELCASFLKLPTPRQLNELRIGPSEYSYLMKCKTYQEAGFQIKPRKDKYTGFELLRDYYDQIHQTAHGTGFDQLFRRPLEQLNPFPKEYFQLVPLDYLLY